MLFLTTQLSVLATGGPGSDSQLTAAGKVVELETGDELTGVCVRIKGTDTVVYTGRNGEFQLPEGVSPESELEFSFVSFETVVIKMESLLQTQTITLKEK